jgi:hypothetical protein
MATQDEFLDLVWEQINSAMQEHWIENVIRESENDPKAPFADLGPVLKRLLDLGASRRDLSLLMRFAAYEAAFGLCYLLNDPGINDNDVEGLHESLLMADPSGLDGRPGSAPELAPVAKSSSGRKKSKPASDSKPKPGKPKLIKRSYQVAFSPDGALLATIGSGLLVWRCPQIEQLAKVSTLSNLSHLAFSPDSRQIAVKNTSGRIALVDVSSQTMTVDFRNQKDGEGTNILFADDGEHLVDGAWKGSHFVRNLQGKVVFSEAFEGDVVEKVLRGPDGRYWFRHFRREDRCGRLLGRAWPLERGKFEELTVPCGASDQVVFTPNGRLLILTAKSKSFSVGLFSFPAMESLSACQIPPLDAGTGKSLGVSPCGRLVAVIGSESQVVLCATTLSVIASFSIKYGCCVDFSPTDSLMAIGSWSAGHVFDTTPYLKACGSQGS